MPTTVEIDGIRYVQAPAARPRKASRRRLRSVLRVAREPYGGALSEAADKAGVSKTYLWQLEAGKSTDPSFRVAARLARLYEIDLEYLASSLDISE